MVYKNGNTIDIKCLRTMYGASQVNKAAFNYFAAREKNSAETKVERMLQVLSQGGLNDVGRNGIVDFFRELEEAKCGKFVSGRRGHASRFAWSVSLVDVGQAASGEAETVSPLTEDEKHDAQVEEAQVDDIEHIFNVRENSKLVLRLPKNLTSSEAARIADFVKTLPFGA